VHLRNLVKDQWAQIDVLLKRRADLIPNLVETVKGYASHEKDTLEAVINARNKAVSATTKEDEIAASGEVTQALSRLFALTESYPELKADKNFLSLQTDLRDAEDKISLIEEFYKEYRRLPKQKEKYKGTLTLELPIEDFNEKSILGIEKTDLSDVIFKRSEYSYYQHPNY